MFILKILKKPVAIILMFILIILFIIPPEKSYAELTGDDILTGFVVIGGLILGGIITFAVIDSSPATYNKKLTYENGVPDIYRNPNIRSVGIWEFNNTDFSDYLTENLIKYSNWRITDRRYLDQILKEQKLQMSGIVDENTIVEIGKIAGIDAIIFGNYSSEKSTIKMLSVETGEYLVFENLKNVGSAKSINVNDNADFAMQALVPYSIKWLKSDYSYLFRGIIFGGNANTQYNW